MTEFETNYERGRDIILNAPQLYIDGDVEADGKPGWGSMLSFGAVSPSGDTFYRELKPLYLRYLPAQHEFCEQHGLERERLLDEGTDPLIAIAEFDEWSRDLQKTYNKKALVYDAFNASFDFPFMGLYYLEAGRPNPYGVAGFCIKSLVQALDIKAYDWSKTSKVQLPEDITPPGDFTHNAIEDSEWQQKLHFAMVGKLRRKEIEAADAAYYKRELQHLQRAIRQDADRHNDYR